MGRHPACHRQSANTTGAPAPEQLRRCDIFLIAVVGILECACCYGEYWVVGGSRGSRLWERRRLCRFVGKTSPPSTPSALACERFEICNVSLGRSPRWPEWSASASAMGRTSSFQVEYASSRCRRCSTLTWNNSLAGRYSVPLCCRVAVVAFEASRWGAPDEREEPRVVHRARGAGRAACHP